MGRRRANNPKRAIGVTLKTSTLEELDELLTYKQSRSKYIQTSLDLRMGVSNYVQDASTRQLMLALRMRDDCDPFVHKLLSQVLGIESLI